MVRATRIWDRDSEPDAYHAAASATLDLDGRAPLSATSCAAHRHVHEVPHGRMQQFRAPDRSVTRGAVDAMSQTKWAGREWRPLVSFRWDDHGPIVGRKQVPYTMSAAWVIARPARCSSSSRWQLPTPSPLGEGYVPTTTFRRRHHRRSLWLSSHEEYYRSSSVGTTASSHRGSFRHSWAWGARFPARAAAPSGERKFSKAARADMRDARTANTGVSDHALGSSPAGASYADGHPVWPANVCFHVSNRAKPLLCVRFRNQSDSGREDETSSLSTPHTRWRERWGARSMPVPLSF